MVGLHRLSPAGPAEDVLATAGSAVGEDCFEAPQIRSPSGVLLPQVADHSLEPGRELPPGRGQPGMGPLGGTGMTARACTKFNTPALVSHPAL